MAHWLKSAKVLVPLLLGLAFLAALGVWRAGWWQADQVLAGRLVDYHKIYDGWWDVACDTAFDGSERRCYIQYVDVYRPRPDFAAAMVEVVYHAANDGKPDPHVRFDIEPGLSFAKARVVTKTADGDVVLDMSQCQSNTCRFSGEAGRAILNTWRNGSALHLAIEEDRAQPAKLVWPLANINTILDDFAAQRRRFDLP